ncbi:MAG: CHAP domain-containing protein, partial [Candidatus Magasanikbacteria bacterium]|nr:CHAP domain-containing protein [Candidatus Magasanikbacteria bacterium]
LAVLAIKYEAREINVEQYDAIVRDTQRSPADMRGLVDNMINLRGEFVPAFLPQAAWDQTMCAGTVETAVNMIAGTELLKNSTAWNFSQVNAAALKPIFDRHQDFKFVIEDDVPRLEETHDSSFQLSALLRHKLVGGTSDRLYVIGYHYHQTHSDRKIHDAHADVNSHLMLLLGKRDNTWLGYDMLHNEEDTRYPFRIASLSDDLPKDFDLVYIWELKGTQMPETGAGVAFVQNLHPYEWVQNRLGVPYLDDVLIYLFGDDDQFPRIERISDDGLLPVAPDQGDRWDGQLLGFFQGVAVRKHAGKTDSADRTNFGLRGQCVELANRFLVQARGFKNLVYTGDADSYFYDADKKGLAAFPNGRSATRPVPGDLIVFDGGPTDGKPGHVAVVTSTEKDSVCFVQQNAREWHTCRSLTHAAGGWKIDKLSPTLPCAGWVRAPLAPAQQTTSKASKEKKSAPPQPSRPLKILAHAHVGPSGDLSQTVRATIARTPGANLEATFMCNEWPFADEATHKVYPNEVYQVCTWDEDDTAETEN